MSPESTLKATFGVSAILAGAFLLFVGYISYTGQKFVEGIDTRFNAQDKKIEDTRTHLQQQVATDHDQLTVLKTQAQYTSERLQNLENLSRDTNSKLDQLIMSIPKERAQK